MIECEDSESGEDLQTINKLWLAYNKYITVKGVILYMIDFEEVLFQFANMHLLEAIPTLNYDNGELLNAFCKYYNSENKYIIAIKVLKVDDYYKIRIRHKGIVEEIKITSDYDECMTLALIEQSYMFIIMERLEQLKNEI